MTERMIPAPSSGTFEPGRPYAFTAEGELLYEGQAVGTVHHSGDVHPVHSPFTGFVMGTLPGRARRCVPASRCSGSASAICPTASDRLPTPSCPAFAPGTSASGAW